ncbi:hypothetical protein PGC08_18505 [Brevibacterium sp. BDJS002]|uniref:hypothetical protein n=1 Tax=Brevibacterium sp. BDJS002 TaxID=3020906 RepID=UPI002306E543|nr:hypothetical protein [Brevibacterium sp. BDJS002]WCE39965.1 hypothetical protein PGC08_18505 [Brevibacterium sp. BDJS002]
MDYPSRTSKNVYVPNPIRRPSDEVSRALSPNQVTPGQKSRPRTICTTVIATVLATLTLAGMTACGPDRGLRVEPEGETSPSMFEPANKDSGPPDDPFSLKEIRRLIVNASGVAVTGKATESAQVVADCKECLKFSTPFLSDDKRFQLVTVANPQQKSEIVAGAVISEKDGEPRLELIATGNQLKLTPGKNGTLVVQEAMFADGDKACCPSGWSVQVFRLHEGRFEPGQRFTRLNGET